MTLTTIPPIYFTGKKQGQTVNITVIDIERDAERQKYRRKSQKNGHKKRQLGRETTQN